MLSDAVGNVATLLMEKAEDCEGSEISVHSPVMSLSMSTLSSFNVMQVKNFKNTIPRTVTHWPHPLLIHQLKSSGRGRQQARTHAKITLK